MKEIEQRKKFIKTRVGEESLEILKESGIDVDTVLEKVIGEQLKDEALLKVQAVCPSTNNTMTSELMYLTKNADDIFFSELTRRLTLIGLSAEKIQQFCEMEKNILKNECEERKHLWVQRYFLKSSSTPENLPSHENLTLSELLAVSDDANAAIWKDHEWLPEEAWKAVIIAACCTDYCERRYHKAFSERTTAMGWSKAQQNAYTKNECILLAKLKWGYRDNPSWTEATTNLKDYDR